MVAASRCIQPEMELVGQRFQQTARFWKTWMAKSKCKGRCREMVHRSALMLKLLINREHESLIAAPTFSLPESIGGVRNWDYRFTWLRDATFTLYALIRLGFVEEVEAFIEWLKGQLSDDAQRGPLQVMYGIDGRQKLDDLTLDHLCGYENSRPVRIGNAAYHGELGKAQLLFEKLLGYANHLGLYSQELGSNGQHLGNFPQAFTHLALVSAATYLDRALSGTDDAVWR